MKLSQWAKKQGVQYGTALKWFHAGKIKNAYQIDTGTILIDECEKTTHKERVCVYVRVSTYERKSCLDGQANRCVEFINARGLTVDKIYREIASGMNDNRIQFWKMINSNPSIIVVENKDRLTRFGYNYLKNLLNKLGCQILVLNNDTHDEIDLMKDLISIITSFCCRLYGLRRGKNKANALKKELKND